MAGKLTMRRADAVGAVASMVAKRCAHRSCPAVPKRTRALNDRGVEGRLGKAVLEPEVSRVSIFRLTPLRSPPSPSPTPGAPCVAVDGSAGGLDQHAGQQPYALAEICSTRHGDRYIIAVRGEFDRAIADALEAAIQTAEATDVRRIVIDLSTVSFLDSKGLHVLLRAQARSRTDSDRLRLVRGPQRVQRVFALTHTEPLLAFLD